MGSRRSLRRIGVLVALTAAFIPACVHLPLPYTAERLALDSRRIPAEALVHYLGQANADPTVCDLRGAGPHLARVDDGTVAALVDGLGNDHIAAGTWSRCVALIWRGLPARLQRHLLTAMGDLFIDQLPHADDRTGRAGPHLAAVEAAFESRPLSVSAPHVLSRLAARTQAALSGRLGARGRALAERLDEVLELGLGRYHGAPVTTASIAKVGDEGLLHRFMARLPDPTLRRAAEGRLIAMRIAASPFPEVREHAGAVTKRLLAGGRNRMDLAEHPIVRGWFSGDGLRGRTLLVRQDVVHRHAILLTQAPAARSGVGLVPTMDLKGLLRIDLKGISRPVTLCGDAAGLDPDPCVEAADLDPASPVTRLDADGVLHFSADVPSARLPSLLDAKGGFVLALEHRGAPMASVILPVRFEPPGPLTFAGATAGPGPDLLVTIAPRGARLVIRVRRAANVLDAATVPDTSRGSAPMTLVLERSDAPRFRIISQGGPGMAGTPGQTGTDGSAGFPGTSASCPSSSGGTGGNGSNGGDGGNGGPGGPGGPGGNILVEVLCPAGGCADATRLASAMIWSTGGPGGAGGTGGEGGSGGAGGSGGSGTSCYENGQSTYVSGGSDGARGSDGSRGVDGPPGPQGAPGKVKIVVERPQ